MPWQCYKQIKPKTNCAYQISHRRKQYILVVMFGIISLLIGVAIGKLCIAPYDAQNSVQITWQVEGSQERITEMENDLMKEYKEYYGLLQRQREVYAQEIFDNKG